MSSLTETENKNNNIQTNKQKKSKQKEIKTTKKNTVRALQPWYLARIQRALTDFTSNLKGYLLHQCNVLVQKITCWTRVSRIFFRVLTLYRVVGRVNCNKISKTLHCFKREPRNNRKNMNIAVLSQGLLSRIVSILVFLKKSVFFTFSTRFRHFGDK